MLQEYTKWQQLLQCILNYFSKTEIPWHPVQI